MNSTAPTALYRVDEDQADDPEGSAYFVLTPLQIVSRYPDLAVFFAQGDGTESLTFTHELYRLNIAPVDED